MLIFFVILFFKQKTAYEVRISDWSSDVCSSDLQQKEERGQDGAEYEALRANTLEELAPQDDEKLTHGRPPGGGAKPPTCRPFRRRSRAGSADRKSVV